jgi:pumilio RNA-binding family
VESGSILYFQNYVIQYVLEHGRPQDRALVISKLCGQVLHLARHKFASNVVEKALVCADANSRRMLIDEMMTPKQEGINPIIAMMKDQFASTRRLHSRALCFHLFLLVDYVLQRALAVADGLQREALINEVRPQLATMRRFSSAYSKHLSSSKPFSQWPMEAG